ALDVLGPTRLLFGTDSSFFPRGWHRAVFDDQARCLWELGVGAADARLIFGGNLQRMQIPWETSGSKQRVRSVAILAARFRCERSRTASNALRASSERYEGRYTSW